MAEERIFIKYYEDTDCLHGYSVERTVELTRQDAIKKIETHLKASTIKFSTTPDVVAEIALNALLEG